jgi:hypothetical protein
MRDVDDGSEGAAGAVASECIRVDVHSGRRKLTGWRTQQTQHQAAGGSSQEPPLLKTSAKKGGKATRRKEKEHTLMAGSYVEECECLWGSVRSLDKPRNEQRKVSAWVSWSHGINPVGRMSGWSRPDTERSICARGKNTKHSGGEGSRCGS